MLTSSGTTVVRGLHTEEDLGDRAVIQLRNYYPQNFTESVKCWSRISGFGKEELEGVFSGARETLRARHGATGD